MYRGKKIAVVIPAYNEEKLIRRAVERVPGFVDHVIVVDDASTDGTAGECLGGESQRGATIVRHEENLGVGGAIITGYRKGIAQGADIIAVMAGDAQMDPDDLPGLLDPVVDGEADYSKGDRLSYPGVFEAMPLVRFVGNHALSLLTRFTSGYRGIRDSQCGYTAVRSRALNLIDMGELYGRYGFPNDLLAHLHTARARLAQVPVRPIYGDEVSGISWHTALFKVPGVLVRSYFLRRRRESREHRLIEPRGV